MWISIFCGNAQERANLSGLSSESKAVKFLFLVRFAADASFHVHEGYENVFSKSHCAAPNANLDIQREWTEEGLRSVQLPLIRIALFSQDKTDLGVIVPSAFGLEARLGFHFSHLFSYGLR